jgi:hypothetical protein
MVASSKDDSRREDLGRHGGLGDVNETVSAELVDLGGELLGHESAGLLARQSVSGDDCGRVDLVSDELVCTSQQLRGEKDDRGCTVSDLFVLLRGERDEDPSLQYERARTDGREGELRRQVGPGRTAG